MINVIIVEDDAASSRRLEQFVKRYFTENPEPYTVKTYEKECVQNGNLKIFIASKQPKFNDT